MTNKQAIDRHRKLMSQSNAIRSDKRHAMKLEVLCALLILLGAITIIVTLKVHDREMRQVERLYMLQTKQLRETNRMVVALAKAGSVNNRPMRRGLPDAADWR